ncbi:MAG: response regulator [Phycisphaerae bacterium]
MLDRNANSILSVAHDELTRTTIAGVATGLPHAQVTYASSGSEALEIDAHNAHDMIITCVKLQGMDGFELASRILASRHRPVVLVGDLPQLQDVIWAMRIGVADFLSLPLEPLELLDTINRCLHRVATARREVHRQQRLQAILRHVLRDRRNLSRRIELLCRDLVGTQRRLFHRVLALKRRTSPDLRI